MFKFKTLLGAFICGVLALGTGIGLNVAGNETLGSAKAAASGPVVAEMSKFTETNTDNIGGDFNVYYTTEKGGAGTAPAIYDDQIRLYQGKNNNVGGSITIHAVEGVTITDVYTKSAMKTSLAYATEGTEEYLSKRDVAINEEYAINDLNAKSVTIGCFGQDKNSRYYVNYICVNYVTENKGELLELTYEGTPVTQYVGQEFNAEGLTFTATYTSGPSVLPASAITFTPSIITEDTISITATYETKSCIINGIDVVKSVNYLPVKSLENLHEGDIVTFGYEDNFISNNEGKYFNSFKIEANTDGSVGSFNDEIMSFTLHKDGDKYSFVNDENKYIEYHGGGNDAYLVTVAEPTNNCLWNINPKAEGAFELRNVGVVERTLQYNTDPRYPRFACYKGTQENLNIYKLDVENPNVKAVQEFIENYLHPEIATDNNADTGACLGVDGYYEKAKAAFNNLTETQRKMFIEDVLFAAMYARLSAWARANHETFDVSTNMLVSANVNMNNIISNEGYLTVIIAVSMLAVSLIAIFAFTKRKAIHK